MTNEEKELLMKDLSARLPYGVQILVDLDKKFDGGVIGRLVGIVPYTGKKYDIQGPLFYQDGRLTPSTIEEVRPYLRPMSSMTEEEVDESKGIFWDFLNAHHFDYRGLIEKGLAIEVTEEINPYEN